MRTRCGILFLAVVAALAPLTEAEARTVSAGTRVANPGATVSVPVAVDDLSDVGAAVVTVGYDPTVAVCLGVEAGAAADAKEMSYVDTENGQICVVLAGFVQSAKGGEIFRMRFSLRDGTAGLFSDVTLLDAQLGAKDGVSDLSATNPLTVVHGMARSRRRGLSPSTRRSAAGRRAHMRFSGRRRRASRSRSRTRRTRRSAPTYLFMECLGLYANVDWRLGGATRFDLGEGRDLSVDMSGWYWAAGAVVSF